MDSIFETIIFNLVPCKVLLVTTAIVIIFLKKRKRLHNNSIIFNQMCEMVENYKKQKLGLILSKL
jgi:hypothetical protein